VKCGVLLLSNFKDVYTQIYILILIY